MWNSKILQYGKVLTSKVFTNGTNVIKVVDAHFKFRNNLIEHLWTFKGNNLHWINFYFFTSLNVLMHASTFECLSKHNIYCSSTRMVYMVYVHGSKLWQWMFGVVRVVTKTCVFVFKCNKSCHQFVWCHAFFLMMSQMVRY